MMDESKTGVSEALSNPTDLNKQEAVEPIAWDDFIFVPDHLFFFKTLTVPAKCSEQKLFDIVQQQVVENSPIAVEQLAWGYLKLRSEESKCLWYSGIRERIQSCIGDLGQRKHILPYAALAILCARKEEICALQGDNNTSVVDPDGLKFSLRSQELVQAAIKAKLEPQATHLPLRFIRLTAVRKDMKGYHCTFKEQMDGGAETESVCAIPYQAIWCADIREKFFLKKLKHQQYWTIASTKGIRWVAAILPLVALLQMYVWYCQMRFRSSRAEELQLADTVRQMEERGSLIRNIHAMTEMEIQAMELLGLLNVHRPKTIYFVNTTIQGTYTIQVDGVAEAVAELEKYANVLRKSGYFNSVAVDNVNASNVGSKFRLICVFNRQKLNDFYDVHEQV